MDWMTDPNSLRSILSKNTTTDDASLPVLTPEQKMEQERQRIIQKEIEQGIREPITGLPYGLYQRKPGEKWLGGGGGEGRKDTEEASDTPGSLQSSLPSPSSILPAYEINTEIKTKLLRPSDQSSSSSLLPSPSSVTEPSSLLSLSSAVAPSWKQKLLERQKEKSSASDESIDNRSIASTTTPTISNTTINHKRPHPDTGTEDSSSSSSNKGIDPFALQRIINGEEEGSIPPSTNNQSTSTSTMTNNSSATLSTSVFPQPPSSSSLLPVTEADFNRLHALSLRAQMMNDNYEYTVLQNQIRLGKEALLLQQQHHHQLNHPTDKRARMEINNSSSSSLSTFPSSSVATMANAHAALSVSVPPTVQSSNGRSNETVEILSPLDAHGRPIASLISGKEAPLAREDLRHGHRAGKLKANINSFTADGERIGYLPEDIRSSSNTNSGDPSSSSSSSAIDLLRMEREETSRSLDDTLMRNILRAGNHCKDNVFSGNDKTGKYEDDNTFDDDIAKAMTKQESRLTAHEQQERDRQRAIQQQKLMTNVLNNCRFCIDSKTHARHLIISLGNHCYLSLPPYGPRLPGHLQLIPLQHISAVIDGEEELYEEINQYKLALHNYYLSQNEGVIFLETSLTSTTGGNKKHTVIDIVPMDKEIAEDAPLFFQKGILDSEEWTTNKTLINTAGKGLRKCIPKGFSYFHVAWAGGGFVHPIEDESTFSPYFGLDIAAGMLGELPGKFGYKEQKLNYSEEQQLVTEFCKKWEPFDFTLRKKTTNNNNNGNGSSSSMSNTASVNTQTAPSSSVVPTMPTPVVNGINQAKSNPVPSLPTTNTTSSNMIANNSSAIPSTAPPAARRRLL